MSNGDATFWSCAHISRTASTLWLSGMEHNQMFVCFQPTRSDSVAVLLPINCDVTCASFGVPRQRIPWDLCGRNWATWAETFGRYELVPAFHSLTQESNPRWARGGKVEADLFIFSLVCWKFQFERSVWCSLSLKCQSQLSETLQWKHILITLAVSQNGRQRAQHAENLSCQFHFVSLDPLKAIYFRGTRAEWLHLLHEKSRNTDPSDQRHRFKSWRTYIHFIKTRSKTQSPYLWQNKQHFTGETSAFVDVFN